MAWRDWIRGPEIEPSIYAADFLRLGEQLESLLAAGVRIVHVDVGDGRFIPPVTIGPVIVEAIAPLVHGAGGRIDCHLMVDSPLQQLELVAEAGADSVSFHVEVAEPEVVIEKARAAKLGIGVAFNPETDVDAAAAAAAGADVALCMSVHPGYSGQAFLPEAIDRVGRLRELVPAETLIQVDGGVGLENARRLRDAGADLFVSASSIFYQDDIAAAYAGLARAVA
jgi:ribulose-phosphate 3-epimerase